MISGSPHARRWSRRSRRAQALLEFALALPIFLVLFIGAVDFGMAFYVKVVLENSAREGAYYLVYNTTTGKASGFAATIAAVQAEGEGSGVAISNSDVTIHCLVGGVVDDTCPKGSTASVAVSHNMDLPVQVIFQGPLHLTNEARMLVP